MRMWILVTDGGPHPPEKWAEVTASQVIDISSTAPESKLSEARAYERRIVGILTRHHANAQGLFRDMLAAASPFANRPVLAGLDPTARYISVAPRGTYTTEVPPVPYTSAVPRSPYLAGVPTTSYSSALPPLRYTARIPGNRMPASNDLPPIAPNQVQTLTCDFGLFLPSGVTLTGTPVFEVLEDVQGEDPDPPHILDGSPQIGTAPKPWGTGVANAAVLQRVSEGVAGARYLIEVTCARTDGDVAEGYFQVPCVAPA